MPVISSSSSEFYGKTYPLPHSSLRASKFPWKAAYSVGVIPCSSLPLQSLLVASLRTSMRPSLAALQSHSRKRWLLKQLMRCGSCLSVLSAFYVWNLFQRLIYDWMLSKIIGSNSNLIKKLFSAHTIKIVRGIRHITDAKTVFVTPGRK